MKVTTLREQVSQEEWQTRVDLAACYRLVAHYGWDDLVFTHISAKVPATEDAFLVNPYGMLFNEITASSLVKIGLAGEILQETEYTINPAGFTIHSAVHEAREDAHCVMHLHTDYGVAVSCQENGLLPLSQLALLPYAAITYHDYEGLALDPEEKKRLVADLGDSNYMLLRNHGTLTTGPTVADAFLAMFVLERACRVQILAQSSGDKLIKVPQPIVAGIKAQAEQVTKGLGGQLAWPGLLRMLDGLDSSYRN